MTRKKNGGWDRPVTYRSLLWIVLFYSIFRILADLIMLLVRMFV